MSEEQTPQPPVVAEGGLVILGPTAAEREDAKREREDKLQRLASAIRQNYATLSKRHYEHFRASLKLYIATGELLLQAKAALGRHGKWTPWLKENCALSAVEAQRYMRCAKHREEIEAKSVTMTDLTLTAALKLIARPQSKPAANGRDTATNGEAGNREPAAEPATNGADTYGPLSRDEWVVLLNGVREKPDLHGLVVKLATANGFKLPA